MNELGSPQKCLKKSAALPIVKTGVCDTLNKTGLPFFFKQTRKARREQRDTLDRRGLPAAGCGANGAAAVAAYLS